MYITCHTINGKTYRNVYLTSRDEISQEEKLKMTIENKYTTFFTGGTKPTLPTILQMLGCSQKEIDETVKEWEKSKQKK